MGADDTLSTRLANLRADAEKARDAAIKDIADARARLVEANIILYGKQQNKPKKHGTQIAKIRDYYREHPGEFLRSCDVARALEISGNHIGGYHKRLVESGCIARVEIGRFVCCEADAKPVESPAEGPGGEG